MSYLAELTIRLALGASLIDASTRERHGAWLLAQQRSDGGFAGREGDSDCYYTSFALRGLLIVDRLGPDVAARVESFLRTQPLQSLGIIDLISLIMSASILEFTAGLPLMDELRRDQRWMVQKLIALQARDGGYAKTVGGVTGSTYQTFLNLLTFELLGFAEPQVNTRVDFLDSQRVVDGGFREIRVAKRAGVNPTAAGIGALKTLGKLRPADERTTADFLLDMQSPEDGGLCANNRIPMSDLLSSCTGLITLIDLGMATELNLARLIGYVRSMERRTPADAPESEGLDVSETGGFHGFAFDQQVDVEYTFYGLACLALSLQQQSEAQGLQPSE